MASLFDHLLHLPLTWLLATLAVYKFSLMVQRRANYSALAHPVVVSAAILVVVLLVVGVDYEVYFNGSRFIHLMLGPATVALAVPLYKQMRVFRQRWLRLLGGAVLGSAAAVGIAVLLASQLGASREILLSMAAKSVTMPIALGLTETLGGLPSLTSALVVLTGSAGAILTQAVLVRLRIIDPQVTGFTLGVVAHGTGTARAMQYSLEAGAFASLGMGLAGLVTAILLPLAVEVFGF